MQGVVGGVASVMMLLQLSYLSLFFSPPWESVLHESLCHSEMVLSKEHIKNLPFAILKGVSKNMHYFLHYNTIILNIF